MSENRSTISCRSADEVSCSVKAPARRESAFFVAILLLLTAVSLFPLWTTRFLPMQDYPQHLFLSHVASTYELPQLNWKEFYRVDLGFRPYMLWYIFMQLLGQLFDAETSGKILFSLYMMLITLLAFIARRLAPKGYLPWGALLLYPFAFSQIYYMGFSNYLLSLPILFMALLDLGNLTQETTLVRIGLHGIYGIFLFLNHPYTVLVYIALALTFVLCNWRRRAKSWRSLLPAGAMCLVFSFWYISQHGPNSTPTSEPWSIHWWPMGRSFDYYLLQFTGMRMYGGPDWRFVGLWAIIALFFLIAWWLGGKRVAIRSPFIAIYGMSLAGFFILPFWFGYYAYFNLRLAPVSYFALSLLLCSVRVTTRSALIVIISVLLLLAGSIQTQKIVSREAETILPILSAAHKNALLLPLVFDSTSAALDQSFFYEIHAHEADYYHLLVGGGANPTLFPNAMMPVQYQPGVMLPYPRNPQDFTWSEHGKYYDYLLLRHAPAELSRALEQTCTLVATSGPWVLFQNRLLRTNR